MQGGTVFDVQNTTNGTKTVLNNSVGALSQDFNFTPSSSAPSYPLSKEEITQVTDLANGYYTINSVANGLALESTGYDNGNVIKQNTAGNLTNQTAYFEKQSDGSYVITFYHSKKSLDLNNNKELTQWNTHKLDNQRWILYKDKDGNILLKCKTDNSYIELKSSIPNDDILMNDNLSPSNPNKKFTIKKVNTMPTTPYVAEVSSGLYKIKSTLSGKNLEIFGGSLDNGAVLPQWINNGYNNQVFEVQNTVDGSYIISNESKKALDISSYSSGSQVIQITKGNVASQKFKITKNPSKEGVFNIISGGETAFDVQSPDNGSRIVLKTVSGLAYQDFNFLQTGDEPTYPSNAVVSNGIYELVSKSNGQAITSSFNVFNGATMGFAASNKGSEQKFLIEQLPNKNS